MGTLFILTLACCNISSELIMWKVMLADHVRSIRRNHFHSLVNITCTCRCRIARLWHQQIVWEGQSHDWGPDFGKVSDTAKSDIQIKMKLSSHSLFLTLTCPSHITVYSYFNVMDKTNTNSLACTMVFQPKIKCIVKYENVKPVRCGLELQEHLTKLINMSIS